MKIKNIFLVCAIFALANVAVEAQNPYNVESTEFDIIVTTNPSSPSIVDFVTALLAEPEDELSGMLSEAWQLYLTNQPARPGGTMQVDKKNGYVCYTLDYDVAYPEDMSGDALKVEMCYWNCADGKHKLVAQNVVSTRNGELFIGQYDGISFYLYDKQTHKLSFVYDIIEYYEEDYSAITYELPQSGKDIMVKIYLPSGEEIQKRLAWDGYRFHFAK